MIGDGGKGMADGKVTKHAVQARAGTFRWAWTAWLASWIVVGIACNLWWNHKILAAGLATLAGLWLARWARGKVARGTRRAWDTRVTRTRHPSPQETEPEAGLTLVILRGSESMLVIRGVGIQLETEYVLGGKDLVFLDQAQVDTVVLNEAVTTTEAFYYLAILLRDECGVAVAFEKLRPGLRVLLPALQTADAMGFFR